MERDHRLSRESQGVRGGTGAYGTGTRTRVASVSAARVPTLGTRHRHRVERPALLPRVPVQTQPPRTDPSTLEGSSRDRPDHEADRVEI